MNKLDYILAAVTSGLYARMSWVISAFSVINEGPEDWKKDPYPYRIVQTPVGSFFVDPADRSVLVALEGTTVNTPPFTFKDRIELKAGQLVNLSKDVVTTVGNMFFNQTCLVHAFGDKVPYVEGRVNISKLENYLIDLVEDTPEDINRKAGALYVSEYIKFCDSITYLTNFSQLCAWGATAKTMTPPPGIIEFKKQLLEQHKDRLHDPVVIAKIDADLVKFDAAYLKGDPGENFLISKKSREIVRKRLFLMHGAEVGLSEGVEVDLIQNSLLQGWQMEKFPAMNNSLRAGSFNRGAQTALGGEAVKWLLRASSNIVVTEDDCGSTMGRIQKVDKNNVRKLVGFSVLLGTGGHTPVKDEEQAGQYLGKTVQVRTPMYCKLGRTDYCKVCVGVKLSQNQTGLSLAVSEYGSAFLDIFMAAGHSKGLILAKMDFKTAIT